MRSKLCQQVLVLIGKLLTWLITSVNFFFFFLKKGVDEYQTQLNELLISSFLNALLFLVVQRISLKAVVCSVACSLSGAREHYCSAFTVPQRCSLWAHVLRKKLGSYACHQGSEIVSQAPLEIIYCNHGYIFSKISVQIMLFLATYLSCRMSSS